MLLVCNRSLTKIEDQEEILFLNMNLSGPSADDRETPKIAYVHLLPILDAIERTVYTDSSVTNSRSSLKIYDPYYCAGSIKTRLQQLGFSFENVSNTNVDCYEEQKMKTLEYDVLLTNPPFSGNHIKRNLSYAVLSGKPWAILMPSNVFLRPWFSSIVGGRDVIYVAPHERYAFEVSSSSGIKASVQEELHIPLVCMWFIGNLSSDCLALASKLWRTIPAPGASLCLSLEQLPRRIRKLLPYTSNRANKKKEKDKRKRVKEKVATPKK